MSAYNDLPGVRFSHLKHMDKSPLHYRAALTAPVDSDALRLGRAFHCAALEPHKFAVEYVVFPGRRSGKAWEAFAEQHAAKCILTSKQHDDAHAMAAAVLVAVGNLFVNQHIEEVVTWTDAATGLACKAQRDARAGRLLVDLKSTANLDYRAFTNSAASFDYHAQMSYYSEPGDVDRCVLVAVEKSAPYDVGVFELDTEALDVGKRRWRKWLDRLAECLAADKWPGRYDSIQQFSLPSWATDVDNLFIPSADEEVP